MEQMCVCVVLYVSPGLEPLSSCQGACFGKLASVEESRSHERGWLHQRVRVHFMQMELGGGGED